MRWASVRWASALAASRPHQALINYVGEVTAHFGPHLLQLDGEWLLFLSLVATQLRLGLRVGAKVLVSAAHPLHVPTEELANTGQGNANITTNCSKTSSRI